MAASGNMNKQSRSKNRRDTENAVFSELADLLPISDIGQQDKLSVLKLTIAYMKMQDTLKSDEQDLEECLATADYMRGKSGIELNPYCEPEHAPLAMLDNEGNLIAGTLNLQKNLDLTNITLPDKVCSDLEKQFIFGSEQKQGSEIEACKEKFKSYKESLEKGMQEFLNDGPSDALCIYNISASTKEQSSEKENAFCLNRSKDGKSIMFRQTDRDACSEKRNHKRARTENTIITKQLCTSAISERLDEQLALSELIKDKESSLILEAATGFIVSLDKDKKVIYVSENVSTFLGHCQSFVIGQDMSEFIYDLDYPELERQMSATQFQGDASDCLQPWQVRRTFYMAMKFIFHKSGSKAKDCGFQLYQWNARLHLQKDRSTGSIRVKGLTSLCCPLLRDSLMSYNNNANVFVVRFSIKENKILYCDSNIQNLLGYSPSELVGLKKSDLKHPADLSMVRCNHKCLPIEGKGASGYYRMLSRIGVWVWVYSYSTIIYNKYGEPEIMVMKSIIVSQAEALCVLSRERSDFERLNSLSDSVDPLPRGKLSPSIASINLDKQKKNAKSKLGFPSTRSNDIHSRQSKAVKTFSKSMSSDKTYQRMFHNKDSNHIQIWRSPQHSQLAQKPVTLPKTSQISITEVKDPTPTCDDKLNSAKPFLQDSPTENNSDMITHLIEQCISEETVMDSCPSSDNSVTLDCSPQKSDFNLTLNCSPQKSDFNLTLNCSPQKSDFNLTLNCSPQKSDFNLTDSDCSIELPFSQQTMTDISSLTSSSSLFGLSSSQQEWALDSLHFANDLQDTSSSIYSSTSQESITVNRDRSPAQATHTTREKNSGKFVSSYQQPQKQHECLDQINAAFSSGDQILSSSSIQTYNDQSFDGFLDVLVEKPLPSSKLLLTPFSGEILLSSLSAPQSITFRQHHNQSFNLHLNTTSLHNFALETKHKNKQGYSDNLASKGIDSSYTTSETEVTPDHVVPLTPDQVVPLSDVNQGTNSLLLNKSFVGHQTAVDGQHQTAADGQQVIISSSENLDHPCSLKMPKRFVKTIETSDELEYYQDCASDTAGNRRQKESCDHSGQRNSEVINHPGINNCINASQISQTDKILNESALKTVYALSISDSTLTTINKDKQSLAFQTGISSQLARNTLPHFCAELYQNTDDYARNSDLLVDATISDLKNKNGLKTNNNLIDVTCPNETLPEDLIDVELDFDIAVGLNENLFQKYL